MTKSSADNERFGSKPRFKSVPVAIVLFCCMLVSAHAAPRLEVIGGPVIQLGPLERGIHHGTLLVTNKGDTPLQLIHIASGGGPLIGKIKCRSVEPGDTCTIEWTLDVGLRSGTDHKTLTLETNDSAVNYTTLTFSWSCLADIEGDLGFANLILRHDTLHNNLLRGEWKMKNVGSDTLSVAAPVVSVVGMEIKTLLPNKSFTLLPGESFTLSMLAKPSGLSSNSRYGHLTFKTSGRYTPELSIPIIVIQ